MRPRIRPSAGILALWLAIAASPIALLTHAEYHPTGSTPGWHFATLSRGKALYPWTRNRLLAWGALYLTGLGLIAGARRKDPADQKLREFAATAPGLLAFPMGALLLLVLLAFVHPFEAVLVGMAMGLAFLVLWTVASSGAALARAVGRLMLVASVLFLFAALGETAMRTPAMVERTGGSRESRAALRDTWQRRVMPAEWSGLPWRSRHLADPKPPDAVRVFALGDSFSYGDFIDAVDQLWPSVLEDRLGANGSRVQVINGAEGGNDTAHELAVLEKHAWSFGPDVVVLQYTLNDAGEEPTEKIPSLIPLIGSSLKLKSSLYQFLDVQFAALVSAALQREGWSASFQDHSPGWRRSREAMRGIVSGAAARGVPVVLLLFPMLDSDLRDSRYRNQAAHDAVAAFAQGLAVPVVDIRRRLAEVDPNPRSWWVRGFDAHPSARAHRLAGEVLAAELVQLGWDRGPEARAAAAAAQRARADAN